jgi:hypothetical protein
MQGCAYEQTIQRSLLEYLQCIPSKTGNRGDAEPTKDKIISFKSLECISRPGKKDTAVTTHTHSPIKSFSSADKSRSSR